MKQLLLLLLLPLSFTAFTQEPSKLELARCGTLPALAPFLKYYHSNPNIAAQDRSVDTIWVAIQAHLLAKDNGTARIPWDRFLNAFCRLNQDFAASNIQFYLKEPWNLLDESDWHNHTTMPAGIDMMLTNNVDGALNAYFVSNPAGNCGYNLPYAGVAIGHSCAGPNDHTWTHEVGHALNLPHPFIGWEGKTYSYNIPTPELVTYDYTYFHDSLETQVPAPLDTALVEYVDGSNCSVAADLICDTKPDYISYIWNCNPSTQMSNSLLKDPDGVDFHADGSLFMSYSDDACQTRFSAEETAIMRATLATEKADWVAPAMLEMPVNDLPVHQEPVMGQNAPVTGAKLIWSSVPNATHYLVQASRVSSYGFRELDIITTDTTAICGSLLVNKTYYWRVKPFNMWHTCQPFTASETFLTVPLTSEFEPDADGWRCYPSLLGAGGFLTMEFPDKWRGQDASMKIFDASGKVIWESYFNCHSPRLKMEIPSGQWPAGIYQCLISSVAGLKRHKLYVQPRS